MNTSVHQYGGAGGGGGGGGGQVLQLKMSCQLRTRVTETTESTLSPEGTKQMLT